MRNQIFHKVTYVIVTYDFVEIAKNRFKLKKKIDC